MAQITIRAKFLNDDDEWQEVTVSAKVTRNKYFNPITEPYEPAFDIENFHCVEFPALPSDAFEEELIQEFYRVEERQYCYYEDTHQEKVSPPVFEMAA